MFLSGSNCFQMFQDLGSSTWLCCNKSPPSLLSSTTLKLPISFSKFSLCPPLGAACRRSRTWEFGCRKSQPTYTSIPCRNSQLTIMKLKRQPGFQASRYWNRGIILKKCYALRRLCNIMQQVHPPSTALLQLFHTGVTSLTLLHFARAKARGDGTGQGAVGVQERSGRAIG